MRYSYIVEKPTIKNRFFYRYAMKKLIKKAIKEAK